MKKLLLLFMICILVLTGCTAPQTAQIATSTMPVAEFTAYICKGTDLTVSQLITEEISCLHDYSVQVSQMRLVENAEVIVISGAGLEDFLNDTLQNAEHIIDASVGIPLICQDGHSHNHEAHHHEEDPHIWLSPKNAMQMSRNICQQLCIRYPEHTEQFKSNLNGLLQQLNDLQKYGEETLEHLASRDLITFHDGFSYFAECYDLTILKSIEEESGSEASAQDLLELIKLVDDNHIPAIFVEANGSRSAAEIVKRETGAKIFTLDMAISGESYFDAMYKNIDTIKGALG